LVAALVVPARAGDSDAARAAAEVGALFGFVVAGAAALAALGMAIAIRRRPMARHLVVVLGHATTAAGPVLEVRDDRGQRRRWPTTAALTARAPLDVPLLVGAHGGRVLTLWEFTDRAPLPSAIAGPRDREE
jgi:hypothetical protein